MGELAALTGNPLRDERQCGIIGAPQ
jgi:hypothetical protein